MGLFSSIMGKFGEADQLKKKLEDPNMKDALKRKELASALEGAQKRGFGENVMGGMKDHFMGKAGNLGFGEGGFSMQTMMDAQKARAEGSPAVPPVTQMAAPSITPVTATAPNAQPMMPQVPRMGGVGPSPALQQIQAAQQQYAMYGMPQQYQAPGLLSGPSLPTTGALNVPQDYQSKLRQMMMYGQG
jgi:hypothetical protein